MSDERPADEGRERVHLVKVWVHGWYEGGASVPAPSEPEPDE